MIKEHLKDPQKIIGLAVTYLFVCSSFYHIAFWSTFGINGLSFIGVAEIIKSATRPLLFFVIGIFIGMLQGIITNKQKDYFENDEFNEDLLPKAVYIIFYLILFGTGAFLVFSTSPIYWGVTGVVWSLLLPMLLADTKTLKGISKYHSTRQIISFFIVVLPVISFTFGKRDAFSISQNKQYEYVVSPQIKQRIINSFPSSKNLIRSDTIKLLGLVDDYAIFTDSSNQYKIYVNRSSIDTIIFNSYPIIND